MPLALKKCHVPLAHRMSHAPGTFHCFYNCSPCEQSSQTADLLPWGCLRLHLFFRCHSPPGMSFLLGKSASCHHSPLEHTGLSAHLTQTSMSHDGNSWAESSPSSIGTVCNGSAHGVTGLCCLKLHGSAPGKCMFMCCFSMREDDFHMTSEVGHWAAILH